MVSKKTKQKAADLLTDQGTRFQVKFMGFNLKLSIKQLTLGTLIQISKEQLKIKRPNSEIKATEIIESFSENAKPQARIIALACVNSKFQPLRKRFLTWLFVKKLTAQELNKLTSIVIESMGVNDFFVSTVSLKGIDLLNQISATVTSQPSPFGEE